MPKKKRKESNKRENVTLSVLILVFVVAVFGLFTNTTSDGNNTVPITGRAVEASAPSSVTISAYLALSLSTDLSNGIDFGTIENLPVTAQDGTANFDVGDQTGYDIAISSDSNVNVDFCLKTDGPLTNPALDTIPLANYVWDDSTLNDINNPALPGSALTTNYVLGSTTVAPGSQNNYRFWLDVDAGQQKGTYSNIIWFEGVETTTGCI
ncbi:hypothetical protein HN865_00550 [Candidatus Woesearchaeota archaeon]|jgi:hypothetical protein|nr:hypothetical protein [Candidatus Woesearchaeota archaeon]MBT7237329.1 hypothetical protein [Candidatus Woesearchaeota archaeon]